jgi:hypothetical protein
MQIRIPDHYKFVIKALASKNQRVLQMAFRFIKQIGELEERAAEYVEHQGS